MWRSSRLLPARESLLSRLHREAMLVKNNPTILRDGSASAGIDVAAAAEEDVASPSPASAPAPAPSSVTTKAKAAAPSTDDDEEFVFDSSLSSAKRHGDEEAFVMVVAILLCSLIF